MGITCVRISVVNEGLLAPLVAPVRPWLGLLTRMFLAKQTQLPSYPCLFRSTPNVYCPLCILPLKREAFLTRHFLRERLYRCKLLDSPKTTFDVYTTNSGVLFANVILSRHSVTFDK